MHSYSETSKNTYLILVGTYRTPLNVVRGKIAGKENEKTITDIDKSFWSLPFKVRLEKCVVALRNSWRVAEGVVEEECDVRAERGEGGGGESAEPGDTEPEEQGVEPPQYLEQVKDNID